MNKITYITSHHWDTKRQGGFHKFAEYTASLGIETVFFSFPRPYYGYFMNREQLNKPLLKMLNKGKFYELENSKSLLNVTFSTLRLPDGITKFFPDFIANFLLTHAFRSFKKFARKYFSDTDCFVFESCEGVALLPKIKKLFSEATIIYRPSDPMVYGSVPERVKKLEQQMLYNADLNLIVNEEGLKTYRENIPDFEDKVKYQVLSNGVDISSYEKTYDCPEILNKQNTILYVGAWEVEWKLLFEAAEKLSDCNFVIVCPNYPGDAIQKKIKEYKNIFYVPGISPKEVPAWITNCSVVIVPYVTDFYKDRPLGITAKYYQAMAAKKPIVAYCDTPKLKEAGVPVTYTFDDFITEVKKAAEKKECVYDFDLSNRKWENITSRFLELIEKCK